MLLFLSGFGLGIIATMWTLHRIGRRMLRKQKEAEVKEQTKQIIRKAYAEWAQSN